MKYVFRITSIMITFFLSFLLLTITFVDDTLLEDSYYFKSAEQIIDSLNANIKVNNAKYLKLVGQKQILLPLMTYLLQDTELERAKMYLVY